jgi:hypothetical protein
MLSAASVGAAIEIKDPRVHLAVLFAALIAMLSLQFPTRADAYYESGLLRRDFLSSTPRSPFCLVGFTFTPNSSPLRAAFSKFASLRLSCHPYKPVSYHAGLVSLNPHDFLRMISGVTSERPCVVT